MVTMTNNRIIAQPPNRVSPTTVDDIIAAVGGEAKREADGSFFVCCPIHEDRTPSLHVSSKSGKLLLHCFGCEASFEDVLSALGMHTTTTLTDVHLVTATTKPVSKPKETKDSAKSGGIRVPKSRRHDRVSEKASCWEKEISLLSPRRHHQR